jgi:hypothetical protein
MDGVAPADGGRTMGTLARFTITVKKLPTNGNELFLMCRVPGSDTSNPDLYFGHGLISDAGRQQIDVRFGGAYSDDPTLVGSSRACFVVSAAPGAASDIVRLMYLDSKHITSDPAGVPYDVQRTSLPAGVTILSGSATVTIERVGPPASATTN